MPARFEYHLQKGLYFLSSIPLLPPFSLFIYDTFWVEFDPKPYLPIISFATVPSVLARGVVGLKIIVKLKFKTYLNTGDSIYTLHFCCYDLHATGALLTRMNQADACLRLFI